MRTRTPAGDYLPATLIKLFVRSALVGGAGLALRAAGVDVPAFGLTMLVLAAALPSAINVSLRAERYGAGNGRVNLHHHDVDSAHLREFHLDRPARAPVKKPARR